MKKIIKFSILCFLFVIVGCAKEKVPVIYEYSIKDIEITHNEFLLDGEVLLPISKTKVPAVVIVGGSGPSDMDGSVGKLKPYKDLAKGLAKKGIASIRFNKVSYQFLNEVSKDVGFTIEDEYLNDCFSAIEILKEYSEIDSSKIFLIGHSMGSQIVPLIMQKDSTIKGSILMAGTTMHLLDILLEQVKAQSEETYNEYLPFVNYAKSLTTVPKGEENYFYFGGYSAYWVSYNKIKLEEQMLSINKPILIMQGGLDLQVDVSHFNNYKTLLKENTNVSYKYYESLNHLFTDGTNETIETAYQVYKEVSDTVINDIVKFIKNIK